MTTPEYDELNTRVSGLENTVFGAAPYDPATVKGVLGIDADAMTDYLNSAGKSVEPDGYWSLDNVLLAASDATAIQIKHGTYVLNIISGTIDVQGFPQKLGIGDQVVITTDENYLAVSATFNDQSALAMAAGKVTALESKVSALEATTIQQAAQIAAFSIAATAASTASWPRFGIGSTAEMKFTNVMYVLSPSTLFAESPPLSIFYEGACFGVWNNSGIAQKIRVGFGTKTLYFPVAVGGTITLKYVAGIWKLV